MARKGFVTLYYDNKNIEDYKNIHMSFVAYSMEPEKRPEKLNKKFREKVCRC